MKKKKNEILLEDKILDKAENQNQSLVQTTKKKKKEKITISCSDTEKFSFFTAGSDNVEKSSLSSINNEENDDLKVTFDIENLSKKSKKGQAKTKTQTIQQIIKSNQNSKITSTYSEKHFSMFFEGARLLTPNVIFSALQYHKYDVFAYKKSWHTIISRELEKLNAEFLTGKNPQALPFFEHSIQLVIFRSAPTLVDEDAVIVMFKYIIDALKRDKNNPHGVLSDDNPKIIFKSESFNEKGEHMVGIRLEFLPDLAKETYNKEKILRMP